MQQDRFRELEKRALKPQSLDLIAKLEARARIQSEVQSMIDEGRAFELTAEEERMLAAFRRFKLRMRKNGEIFRWQTIKPDGIIIASDTAEIIDPCEARK